MLTFLFKDSIVSLSQNCTISICFRWNIGVLDDFWCSWRPGCNTGHRTCLFLPQQEVSLSPSQEKPHARRYEDTLSQIYFLKLRLTKEISLNCDSLNLHYLRLRRRPMVYIKILIQSLKTIFIWRSDWEVNLMNVLIRPMD